MRVSLGVPGSSPDRARSISGEFPATYQHEVQSLVDAAGFLMQEQAPIDALRSWVERLARYAVTKHGLASALRKATTPRSNLSSTDTYRAIVAALDRLLRTSPPARCAQALTPTT